MKDTAHLIFNRRGIDRMAKGDGFTLKSGERAVRIEIDVPDEVFQPQPIPTIVMTVPQDALITRIESTAVIRTEGEPE